jgi:AcrR family transcriptional regulator
MTRDSRITRREILAAADELFYGEGLRSVSVDEISAKAGITKKTLYYHFRSKDELIAAYLEARDRPTLERFQRWAGDEGAVAERLKRMFLRLGRCAKSPTWKGCGFVRATGELANIPGHPAVRIARAHKANFEKWLSDRLAAEGYRDCAALARGLMVVIDGAVTQMLLHRDPRYAEAASHAACALLGYAPRTGHCEPPARANARLMTGSAKRSAPPHAKG